MSRLGVVVLLVAACFGATLGCSVAGSSAKAAHSSPAAVGDTCLVGRWTLQQSINTSGYTFNNVPLRVAGLKGATMSITLDGTGSEDFAESDPLVGTTTDGGQLSITLRGKWAFAIKATGHKYVESGATTALPTTATFNGKPATYQSSYEPSNGTYSCTSSSLTMTSDNQVQIDTWLKG